MDLYAYKKNNGAHIYAWNRKNGTNQRWILQSIGRRRYLIKSHHSGKCLDNTGRAAVNRHYHQWNCSSRNANQHFYFIKMNARRAKRRGGKKPRGGRKGRKARGGKKPRGGKKKILQEKEEKVNPEEKVEEKEEKENPEEKVEKEKAEEKVEKEKAEKEK